MSVATQRTAARPLEPRLRLATPVPPGRLRRAPVGAGVDLVSAATSSAIGFTLAPWADRGPLLLLLALVLLWPVLVATADRGRPSLLHPSATGRTLLRAAVQTLCLIGMVVWIADLEIAPGLVLLLVGATVAIDLAARSILDRYRGAERRVLLVGPRDSCARLAEELGRAGAGRLRVVGWCTTTVDVVAEEACRSEADDVVLLPSEQLTPATARHLIWRLADQRRRVHLAPTPVGVGESRTRVESHDGVTLVGLNHSELRSLRRTLMLLAGRMCAALLLLLLAPLLLLLAVAIRLDSPGPVLFVQERIGHCGRRFRMLKLRTMAELGDVPERVADQFLFKLRQDPRITRVGAFLRRYSLDELPQLINVVRGEMALVGPRPCLPEEMARYADDVHRRLAVHPGLTGLWQVSGRSDLSWEETVRLDLEYVDNWTPALDLRILFRTVRAVLGHRGAY
ncbi:exopolysaccharide biosynthesis polyprenyl glycosylphosphotransferase [Nocardioides daejeonensis]|uniref:exopolysaccharide biosynthesis polyprenyl glycosylphosphotransferase n=1 Tax=Nocardioides daejeonensis TaxID=1046556 RepID=UPI000D74310B|nr:exopolysaccharide biosynthesis polyprenyl glycosylphosphotransferase [Nocardioides daejeonensis]